MKSRTRVSEIHFYEWSISRWVTSTAHDELDALGRGVYREMIDACYAQGSVTADHLQAYLEEFTFRFNRRTSTSRGLVVASW